MSHRVFPVAVFIVFLVLSLALTTSAREPEGVQPLPLPLPKAGPKNKPTPLPALGSTSDVPGSISRGESDRSGHKPAKSSNTLATLDFPLDAAGKNRLFITKTRRPDGIYLIARDISLRTVWISPNLGSEDKTFFLDDKATILGVKELTGDGLPELVSSAFYGPSASGLYVYSWNPSRRVFSPITNVASETEPREHLVSDIPVESGDDMVIERDGTIRLLGRVFDPRAEHPPTTGIYVYRFRNGVFHLQTIEMVPAPDAPK